MVDVIRYAVVGGPPDNWHLLGIKYQGIEMIGVLEANVDEGWLRAYALDENNKPVRDGEKFKEVTLYGEVEIFVKHNGH